MSLRRISLKDFVIVEALDVDLCDGFTALTGETGAGKSILIDAVQIALGQRAEASVIRHGATRCEITIELSSTPALADWLTRNGFDDASGLDDARRTDAGADAEASNRQPREEQSMDKRLSRDHDAIARSW